MPKDMTKKARSLKIKGENPLNLYITYKGCIKWKQTK